MCRVVVGVVNACIEDAPKMNEEETTRKEVGCLVEGHKAYTYTLPQLLVDAPCHGWPDLREHYSCTSLHGPAWMLCSAYMVMNMTE